MTTTETKQCSTCKEKLPITMFNLKYKNKSIRHSKCIACARLYSKAHYQANKEVYKTKAKGNNPKYRLKNRIEFYNWLKTKKCVDCGNSDFRVLEFDHLKDKEFGIATKIGSVRLETLKEEIAKCDIVCANCHRIRTAIRANHYSYLK